MRAKSALLQSGLCSTQAAVSTDSVGILVIVVVVIYVLILRGFP
jgi:hypothetical protein